MDRPELIQSRTSRVEWATPAKCRLTPRWGGLVRDKVPSSGAGARTAQLNRQAALMVRAATALCVLFPVMLGAAVADDSAVQTYRGEYFYNFETATFTVEGSTE